MFETLGRAAERAADGLSRRSFLGWWAGKGALAAAAALAGLLVASPGKAWAGKCPRGCVKLKQGGCYCGGSSCESGSGCPAGYYCCGCQCIPNGYGCGATPGCGGGGGGGGY